MNNKKGQIAIEYIIFLSILLLFFQAIVYPNISFSENVIKDIHTATQAKQSIEKLVSDITYFNSSLGYGERSIYFYLPTNAKINACEDNDDGDFVIKYQIEISKQKPFPSVNGCDKDTGICDFEIKSPLINCEDTFGPGYNSYIVIEKTDTGDINVKAQ